MQVVFFKKIYAILSTIPISHRSTTILLLGGFTSVMEGKDK